MWGCRRRVCDNHCSRTNAVPLCSRCLLRVILCQDRSRPPSLAASLNRRLCGGKNPNPKCVFFSTGEALWSGILLITKFNPEFDPVTAPPALSPPSGPPA